MPTEVLEKPATIEDLLHEAARVREMVTEAVEDGVHSAIRALKQGRYAAEDALDDAKHAVKKNPLQAVALVFAAGAVLGALTMCLAMRRRKRA